MPGLKLRIDTCASQILDNEGNQSCSQKLSEARSSFDTGRQGESFDCTVKNDIFASASGYYYNLYTQICSFKKNGGN